jgi:hypothetical protein
VTDRGLRCMSFPVTKVDVSVAAKSVVAVRWAFRQHAATEVGGLVRLRRDGGGCLGPLSPRRRWVSWSASSRQLWIADLLVLPNQLKVILQRLVTGGRKGGRKPSAPFPESRAFGLLDESAALGETRRNRRGNGTEEAS